MAANFSVDLWKVKKTATFAPGLCWAFEVLSILSLPRAALLFDAKTRALQAQVRTICLFLLKLGVSGQRRLSDISVNSLLPVYLLQFSSKQEQIFFFFLRARKELLFFFYLVPLKVL